MELTDLIRGEQYYYLFLAQSSRHNYRDLRETAIKLSEFASTYVQELEILKQSDDLRSSIPARMELRKAKTALQNINSLVQDYEYSINDFHNAYTKIRTQKPTWTKEENSTYPTGALKAMGHYYIKIFDNLASHMLHEFSELMTQAKESYSNGQFTVQSLKNLI